MQKIVPHLWYDREAKEAVQFYMGLFEDSKLLNVTVLEETPSGDSEIVSFQLAGQEFQAISAGPYFTFNPAVSLMVACDSVEEVNAKWEALIDGGTALMPLGEYPFNKWYGWVQDKYGLTWQLMLRDDGQAEQKITPNLLFSSDACGKAEEAIRFYADVFADAEIGSIHKYEADEAQTSKAKVKYADFQLSGMHFTAMDHGMEGDFHFNEAFSLMVNCKDQEEIDYFWDKLSAVPEAEQCGWVKDKFGVSWQIVPDNMEEVLFKGPKDEARRAADAMLKMKKMDIRALEMARAGK
ncbi:VOC family protein [Virgibacillus ihumii]|uniref:VOC family protein n=1 Tax=Virgibacillus ihumii TaxID=2686091 RepID=UPI00157C7EDE|nr:VOC family protein [Virgibacillus ihumii]